MERLLLILALAGAFPGSVAGQDSTTAAYINTVVERIDTRLLSLDKIVKDTVIYEELEEGKRSDPLRIRTETFYNSSSKQVEKIVERSRYRTWVTELDVYFLSEKPIRMTSTKWNSEKIIVDFDLYYMQDNFVFCSKRDASKSRPDADFFLKWCYDLLQTGKTQ
jgi:hypothetical protein